MTTKDPQMEFAKAFAAGGILIVFIIFSIPVLMSLYECGSWICMPTH